MTQQQKATLYGLSAVLLWSTVATAFKLSLRYLTPIELLLFSGGFSTALLGAILLLQGKLKLAFQCSRQEYLLSLCLGLLSPFLYYLVLLNAISCCRHNRHSRSTTPGRSPCHYWRCRY